ncbi:MAG TPA: WXG100 family type VII secretion target [Anaerolineales bacterium]|nr:WXG100 family type VII secretion target [Anaerolineales bacterium]
MTDKVRMNYQTMREMTKEFKAAQQQLEETIKAVTKMGKEMEGGGLQGQAGETFVGAINGPLVKALKKLSAKMGELAGDVDGARMRLEEGVATAKTRFQN